VKSAAKDLTSLLNSKKRVANQAQAAADQAVTPKRARTTNPLAAVALRKAAIFEVGVATGKQVETVRLAADMSGSALTHVNFGLPVLMTTGNWQPMLKDSHVQAAISQFQSAWMTSAMRQASGRAAQKLVEPARKTVFDAFTQPLAQLTFWSKRLNWQLRVSAVAIVDFDSEQVKAAWERIRQSRASADYLGRVPPGDIQPSGEPAAEPPRDSPLGHHLAILNFQVRSMDWLALSQDGHHRARLKPDGGLDWLVP
jgi:hypothetical protein